MLAKKIWETLSKIDVNEKVEKKGNLSYLSWAWAWGELMKHFPCCSYSFREDVASPDKTVTVWVDLTISEAEESLTREMWLPVMDHKNKAVINPTSRQISDTRMRCLTKCIAMFGLGHYIYAGEDLPEDAPLFTPIQKQEFDELFESGGELGLFVMRQKLGEDVFACFFDTFPQGKKTAMKKKLFDFLSAGNAIVDDIVGNLQESVGDDLAARQGWEELTEDEKRVVWPRLSTETQDFIKQVKQ